MSERGSRRRGEGAFRLIFGIAFAAVTVMVLLKIVPLHIHGAEISDAMDEQANFGGVKRHDKMQWDIFQVAQKNGAPLPLEGIEITTRGALIVIHAKYEESVDVFGYKYTYKFDKKVEKPIF